MDGNGHSHMDYVSHTILLLIREATAEGTEQAQQTPEPKLYDLKKKFTKKSITVQQILEFLNHGVLSDNCYVTMFTE